MAAAHDLPRRARTLHHELVEEGGGVTGSRYPVQAVAIPLGGVVRLLQTLLGDVPHPSGPRRER